MDMERQLKEPPKWLREIVEQYLDDLVELEAVEIVLTEEAFKEAKAAAWEFAKLMFHNRVEMI